MLARRGFLKAMATAAVGGLLRLELGWLAPSAPILPKPEVSEVKVPWMGLRPEAIAQSYTQGLGSLDAAELAFLEETMHRHTDEGTWVYLQGPVRGSGRALHSK